MYLTISILIILIILYVWANNAYKHTNHYKNTIRDLESYIKDVPKNIKIANFGTTNSYYAFKYHHNLDVNSWNFALNCESLELDLDIFKHYSTNFSEGCIIILNLNFCVCMYRRNQLDESKKAWVVLPKSNSIKVPLKQKIKHYFPVLPFDIKKTVRIFYDSDSNVFENKYFVESKQAQLNARNITQAWIKLFRLKSLKDSNVGESNEKNIEFNTNQVVKFLELCKEKNFFPVVCCTPLGKFLNKEISDEFVNTTLGKIKQKAKEMQVPFLDYRKDERFQNELSLFMDGGYRLTERGSRKYLMILLDDVQKFYHIQVNNETLC